MAVTNVDLSADLVGKVVVIQTFEAKDENTIEEGTLKKYVGVLEGFTVERGIISIMLKGVGVFTVNRGLYVEVYIQ